MLDDTEVFVRRTHQFGRLPIREPDTCGSDWPSGAVAGT